MKLNWIQHIGSIFLELKNGLMRWRHLELFILNIVEIIGNTDLCKIKSRRVRLVGNYFILNQKPFVHFFKATHVSGNVVLDIFDATYLEYHKFVDSISYLSLSLCLNIRKLLTYSSIGQKILFNCMVVTVDSLCQITFQLSHSLVNLVFFFHFGPGLCRSHFLELIANSSIVSLGEA